MGKYCSKSNEEYLHASSERTFLLSEEAEINFESVVQSPVLFFFATTTRSLSKKIWRVKGNYSISKFMPFQAYKSGKTLVCDYTSSFYGRGADSPDLIVKNISSDLAAKLARFDHWVSSNSIEEALNVHLGFTPKPLLLDLEDYMPKPEGVVWKIFPEIYSDPYAQFLHRCKFENETKVRSLLDINTTDEGL